MPRILSVIALLTLVTAGCAAPGGEPPAASATAGAATQVSGQATAAATAASAVGAATAPPVETGSAPSVGATLDCAAPAAGSVELVACNVMAGVRSRNLSALHGSMADPFRFGIWRTEGVSETPANITKQLGAEYLPSDPANPMTFTVGGSAIPALRGMPVESLMGPDVNVALVLSSTGWGQDGAGEALLFFTDDPAGKPKWYGLLLAPTGFR
jgi:hypothetical protein